MEKTKTLILDTEQINHKINRIAHEIYENNFDEKKIYIIGVETKGFELAKKVHAILETISDQEFVLTNVTLDKDHPLSSVPKLGMNLNDLAENCVVLVDDVLNSGRTLAYATMYLLHTPIRKLQTSVLLDRKHRRFPIRADIVGLTLSTTLEERIVVEIDDNNNMEAYLV